MRSEAIAKMGKLKLYPYQREGVDFLVMNALNGRGSLLADSMGLGKTCQTIAALARLWKIDRANYFPCVRFLSFHSPKFVWHGGWGYPPIPTVGGDPPFMYILNMNGGHSCPFVSRQSMIRTHMSILFLCRRWFCVRPQ